MLNLGPIAFAQPWVLLGLISIPAAWFLLRLIPPPPKKQIFPAIMLLNREGQKDPPPDTMPLWLLILRMTALMLLVLALAGPILNPGNATNNNRPVLLVIDNGWQAAHDWAERMARARQVTEQASANGVNMRLVLTANKTPVIGPLTPQEAIGMLQQLSPQAWSPASEQVIRALQPLNDLPPFNVFWITDGLEHAQTGELKQVLDNFGALRIILADAESRPVALLPPDYSAVDPVIRITAPPSAQAQTLQVIATGDGGRRLGSTTMTLAAGEENAEAALGLPLDVRNQVRRLAIESHRSAGATYLTDSRDQHPKTGIFAGEVASETPPLRSARFYLSRALSPYASVIEGSVERLLDQGPSILVLANSGEADQVTEDRLFRWVQDGGLLIRFAGENLAENPGRLVPTPLRSGSRAFGGSLTWDEPQQLQAFDPASPFYGLNIPDEVTVTRQILAAPDIDLPRKTWARLEDGTPLVTGANLGQGRIVLFHTSANTDWSNLALSGLYVDMLRRLLALANSDQGDSPNSDQAVQPEFILNGFGEMVPAQSPRQRIERALFERIPASQSQPPGLYTDGRATMALNLAAPKGPVTPHFRFREMIHEGRNVERGFDQRENQHIGPLILVLGLFLILCDGLAALYFKGLLNMEKLRLTLRTQAHKSNMITALALAGASLALAGTSCAAPALAQEADVINIDPTYVQEVTSQTRIAYVETGNQIRDQITLQGLTQLGLALQTRTSVELGQPMAVSPEADTLSLFPLIYWPVGYDAQELSPAAKRNLMNYLLSGGMVWFDTGIDDEDSSIPGIASADANNALQRLLSGLDIPTLGRVDQDHVLSKSYYLLDFFPGRISGRAVWVDARSMGADGLVSPVIIGGHDWASAWAPTSGERDPSASMLSIQTSAWQREYAMRFGINVVMYALTGTYKADQLHMNTIIDRLKE